MTHSCRTLCEAFQATAAAHPDAVAVRTPDVGVTVTWRDYADRVSRIAAGLAAFGVRPGDTVGLMMTNRPEFHLIDTAVLHIGAIPFSIYNTNPPEKIVELFANADNRIVLCEAQFADRLVAAQAMGSKVEQLICLDEGVDGTVPLTTVEAAADPNYDFESAWRAVDPDSPATIIYTSGTTGPPKGVELTHANVLADHRAIEDLIRFGPADSVISYLPDAHAANRMFCHWSNLIYGIQVVTVDNIKSIADALKLVRPTGFLGTPQVWYKLKAAIESALADEPSPIRRRLATWAIGVGRAAARRRSDGAPISAPLRAQTALAERLVLSTLRERLGMDRVRLAASGAAPIAPEAHEFILGLGLTVIEVWGMSECTAVATMSPPDAIRIGTVGKVVPTCEVLVAEDGELLIRGPMVMPRYRNKPEKTVEAIDAEGWLHSGDIGAVDADGYFRIIDRKKELIINAAGKNMSPSNIEGAIRVACPILANAVAIGDDRPYVTALLTLDPDAAAAYAARHGIAGTSPTSLAADAELRKHIEAGIERANAKLAGVEQIKKFVILPDVWEPGGDLVTPTMKLKRKPIGARYATVIESMYR